MSSRFRHRIVLAAAIGVSILVGVPAPAQRPMTPLPECAERLPPSAFTRVTVYLAANPIDSVSRNAVSSVDLLTQSVAARLREMMGAKEAEVPAADSVLRWHELGAVTLRVYADGRYVWREPDTAAMDAHEASAGEMLLRRALAETANGKPWMFLPEGSLRDSALFGLSLRQPIVSPDGQSEPIVTRLGFPVFTLPVPWTKPVRTIRHPRITYPKAPLNASVEGVLILRFIVDTTGRVDMSSIRDVWPAGRPRLTGELGAYYEAFRKAAAQSLEDVRYEPAEIGGCRVRVRVQQPFAFKLGRSAPLTVP